MDTIATTEHQAKTTTTRPELRSEVESLDIVGPLEGPVLSPSKGIGFVSQKKILHQIRAR